MGNAQNSPHDKRRTQSQMSPVLRPRNPDFFLKRLNVPFHLFVCFWLSLLLPGLSPVMVRGLLVAMTSPC